MVKKLWRAGGLVYGAAVELVADDGLVLAASIAFFTIFSLAPILLLVVAVAGLAFGQDQTRAEIQSQFESELCRAAAGQAPSADAKSGVVSRLASHIRERLSQLPEPRRFPAATEVIEGILYSLMELFNIELTVMKNRLTQPGSFN
jgi:hypothetical protein